MKGFLLKPHEAQALAAGKPVAIWRVLKEQPDPAYQWCRVNTVGKWHHIEADQPDTVMHTVTAPFPIGVPLFGKETWCEASPEHRDCKGIRQAFYKATMKSEEGEEIRQEYIRLGHNYTWKASTTMPEWASRITLTLSDVKVRRPRDVTEEEAKAIGLNGGHDSIPNYPFSATPSEHWKAQWGWPEPKTNWNLYHFTALATPHPKA